MLPASSDAALYRTAFVRQTTDRSAAENRIPLELQQHRQWVCWRYEPNSREGKPAKVPYDPITGKKASATASRTWASFHEAQVADHNRDGNPYDGIGYIF